VEEVARVLLAGGLACVASVGAPLLVGEKAYGHPIEFPSRALKRVSRAEGALRSAALDTPRAA
jgi:hypothetical protein